MWCDFCQMEHSSNSCYHPSNITHKSSNDNKLDEAINLLVEAEAIMNSLYVAIIDYNRTSGWVSFGKLFNPLKDRIYNWQDKLWETDFIAVSPSASPSQAPDESEKSYD